MSTGIYRVSSTATPRVYCGASRNLDARMATHLDPQSLSSNGHLHKALTRYGVDTFSAKTIVLIDNNAGNNFIAAMEGIMVMYHHFILDLPMFNVRWTAGESFTDGEKTINNLIDACLMLINGIKDGKIKVVDCDTWTRLEIPEYGSVVFYEWEPDIFEKVLPFIYMMKAKQLSTQNPDCLNLLHIQHKFRNPKFNPFVIRHMALGQSELEALDQKIEQAVMNGDDDFMADYCEASIYENRTFIEDWQKQMEGQSDGTHIGGYYTPELPSWNDIQTTISIAYGSPEDKKKFCESFKDDDDYFPILDADIEDGEDTLNYFEQLTKE